MFRNMKIKNKIGLVFIILMLTVTVVTNYGWHARSTEILESRIIEAQQSTLQELKWNLDGYFDRIERSTNSLISDKVIAQIVNDKETDPLQTINNVRTLDAIFGNLLYVFLDEEDQYEVTGVLFVDDYPIARHIKSSTFEDGFSQDIRVLRNEKVKNDQWYSETMKRFNLYIFNGLDEEHVYISRALRNPFVNDLEFGVVLYRIRKEHFGDYIGLATWSDHDVAILRDAKGDLIFASDEFESGMQDDYIINSTELEIGWSLELMTPLSIIDDEVWDVQRSMILVSVVVIAWGLLIAYLLAYVLAKPVNELVRHVKAIDDDLELIEVSHTTSKDEIGILNHEFNQMILRIRTLIHNVFESSEREKKAKIKALQAQINPHFIYNTLDTVNWMALAEGQDGISDISTALADILRYNLKNPDELVRLRDELIQINRYLLIQSAKYDDRLSVRYMVDDKWLTHRVPKCIMQPIVENAFKHGVTSDESTLELTISVSSLEDRLKISIADNGSGADCAKLNLYLEENREVYESDSIGIINVHNRLRLLYGESYGLHYESNETGGVTATLSCKLNMQ